MKVLLYYRKKTSPYNASSSDIKDVEIFNISDDKEFKKVLTKLFKEADKRGYFFECTSIELCNTCNGEFQVFIKGKSFTCPDCNGHSIDKDQFSDLQKELQIYKKAKKGDLFSLKKLMLIENSSEIKIVELK